MTDQPEARASALAFDRRLVLEQLGGWRGMVDASLPTVAFVVADLIGGLHAGIWAAVASALMVFALRLVRRQSVQQAFSGLFAVAVAVALAAASGQARDYFLFGILRNVLVGAVLVGSIPVRWPLLGVIAEFLAPSHLGGMADHSLWALRRRARSAPAAESADGEPPEEPLPERHWREDPRLVRAYGWLTLLWGGTFLLRALVSWLLYQKNAVGLLGTASLVLGLPVTAVALAITLWVIARLHRHRRAQLPEPPQAPPAGEVSPA